MKIAFLGDLHGNRPATEAIAAALDKHRPDRLVFMGDAVGKGPSNAFTCDWVRAHCDLAVGGNWDYGIGAKQYSADQYFWHQLGEERMRFLRELPIEAELTLAGIRFRLYHGRPLMPLMVAETPKSILAMPFESDAGERFGGVIFADSHRPFVRTLNEGYVINTGSVGNNLGVVRAHALLLEAESEQAGELSIQLLSVPYDVEAAIRDADPDLPHREEYIQELRTGRYARGPKAVTLGRKEHHAD